jgi:hypothetical protein
MSELSRAVESMSLRWDSPVGPLSGFQSESQYAEGSATRTTCERCECHISECTAIDISTPHCCI